ncbi:MAG: hypothetical protein PWQ95_1785 [Thermococcaceae archaeon]|nr:hypothetical protein [Thermococcaceae archaeon]
MASGLKTQKEPATFENAVLKWMNFTFDLVVIVLAVLIMIFVIRAIYDLVEMIFAGVNVEEALHELLLVIILLELFELLTLYIKEHHVSMRRVAELGVVAIVRKLVITVDYKVLGWEILVGMAALIFTLGWIYVQERRRVSEEEKFLVEHGLDR